MAGSGCGRTSTPWPPPSAPCTRTRTVEAAAHYSTALAAAERLGVEIGPAQWAAVYEARGRVWLGMDDDATAIADLERALEQAGRAGDDRRVLSAQRNLALARFWHHQPVERALAHAEGALKGARHLGDRLETAACAAVLASILVTRSGLREGIAYAEEAVQVGRGAGDDALVADAVGTLGAAHGWHGSFRQARTELTEALALVQTRPWGMLIVPKMLFFSAINAGGHRIRAGAEFLARCERYARESEDRWWLTRLPNTVGWVYQELYDRQAALRHNLEGVEAARRSPWPEPLANALINLGMDYLQRQDLDKARRAFDKAAGLLGRVETMQWRWEIRLWLGLGEWWLARGDTDQSLGLVDRSLALARQTRTAKNVAKAHQLRGLALASRGQLARARSAHRHRGEAGRCAGQPAGWRGRATAPCPASTAGWGRTSTPRGTPAARGPWWRPSRTRLRTAGSGPPSSPPSRCDPCSSVAPFDIPSTVPDHPLPTPVAVTLPTRLPSPCRRRPACVGRGRWVPTVLGAVGRVSRCRDSGRNGGHHDGDVRSGRVQGDDAGAVAAAAEAWHRWGPTLEDWLGPATEAMLDMAGVGPAAACSTSPPAPAGRARRRAARRAHRARAGHRHLARTSSTFAAQEARRAGLANVETQGLDGEQLDVEDGSFDAVISRVGLIYFPDQHAALRRDAPGAPARRQASPRSSTRRRAQRVLLDPGRRSSAAAPSCPPPAPGQPGPFSLGRPGRARGAPTRRAGFRDVADPRSSLRRCGLASAAECVRFERESFGALHQMLAGLTEAEREAAWDEIEQELRAFEGSHGFEGPCELIVAAGTRY